MIRIAARLGAGYVSIETSGHEDQAENGRVCAAVSAITQTALLGLREVARQHPEIVSIEIQDVDVIAALGASQGPDLPQELNGGAA